MKIKILTKGCIPKYAHDDDGCMDCFASKEVEWCFENGTYTATIPLGFSVDVPKEYVLLMFSRSGMGFKYNQSLVNSVGVIDCGFQGEVVAKLTYAGKFGVPKTIKKGDRVAQIMLVYRPKIYLEQVKEFTKSDRGDDGFGSTGL